MLTKRSLIFFPSAIALCLCVMTSAAQAQATRTWVSGLGDDANPCSRTAPCKTFAGAMSRTAAGGEIDAQDPGGYGTVTIPKAMTIDGGGGQVASALTTFMVALIQVSAGANDRVILRNLRITGVSGQGAAGVNFSTGLALSIENCSIFGTAVGVAFTPMNRGFLTVANTVFTGNGAALVSATQTGTNRILLTNVTVSNNSVGIGAGPNTKMQLTSVYIGQTGNGGGDYGLIANGPAAEINVEASTISDNQLGGIHATNTGVIRVGNSTVVGNNTNGILIDNGGSVQSYGNNHVAGNAGAQAFSPGIVPQT